MRGKWIIGGAVVAVLAAGAWFGRDAAAFADIGTAYAAKQTCSCVFVSGRTLESCRADLPAAPGVDLKIAVSGDEVTASALGLFKASARFENGYGCSPIT
jgi:hypothetical protein